MLSTKERHGVSESIRLGKIRRDQRGCDGGGRPVPVDSPLAWENLADVASQEVALLGAR